MRKLFVSLAAIATLTVLSGGAHSTDTTAAPTYTVLDETASKLRADFNRAKGSVRVLFVVDPRLPRVSPRAR